MLDKNKVEINKGDVVDVPHPDPERYLDCHQAAFRGTVSQTKGIYVTVVDSDGDHWAFEPERVEIVVPRKASQSDQEQMIHEIFAKHAAVYYLGGDSDEKRVVDDILKQFKIERIC